MSAIVGNTIFNFLENNRMIAQTKRLLAAPIFADEDKTRLASLLNITLYATLIINLLYSASLLFTVPEPALNLVANAILFLLQLCALLFMRRGQVHAASFILVGTIWLYGNFVILFFGGSQSPAVIIYSLVIVIAGLLLGGRTAIVLAIASMLAVFLLLYIELNGYLPPSLIPITPVYTWVASMMGIIIMAILLYLATQSLSDALANARRSAKTLAEKNRQLEEVQTVLKERVLELKQAELALRASEERLRTVVNNAPIIIWGVNRQGILTLLEGKTLEQIGFRPEEFVGLSIFDITDTRVPQLGKQFEQALQGESLTTIEHMRGRTLEMRYSPLMDEDGQVSDVIGIAIDITERQHAEEMLFQAQKLESLGILAGGIAHDFNNLLVAILGQTSLAQKKLPPDHPAYLHLDKAVSAIEKAASLVRQMLSYSGRSQLKIESIDLNRLIEDNIHLFQASLPKNVVLRTELQAGLPLIEGDWGQMQQVIMNLIINGVEAIGQKAGTVIVTTSTEEMDMNRERNDQWIWSDSLSTVKQWISLEVSDNGQGMDEKTVTRIFDPFFTTKPKGHGLGLAAVLGILRSHQGSVQVQSKPDGGTTFKLLFPAGGESSQVIESSGMQVSTAGQHLVLVVDDEQPVREAISDILEDQGMQLLMAADGQTAIQLLQEYSEEIDLVLLDLSMPGMGGEEVLQEMRKINPTIRVILSSGYDKNDVLHRMRDQPLSGFIQKPYTLEALIEIVQQNLTSPD
ncbi:MAG: response regulator [Chloroflexota bacterium]